MYNIVGAIGITDQLFSEDTANVVLLDVMCNGSESSLTECGHNIFGQSSCGPLEDAGVICQGN